MKTTPHTSPFAPTPLALGVFTAQISQSADGWAQLLPAGHFSAVDGRPFDVPSRQWFLDSALAEQLIDGVRRLKNDRVIDYEHQTLLSEENGQPAIAAGWFNADEIQWREGDGLYIKPRWTDKARAHIQADEYLYLSAVAPYDVASGEIRGLQMAALTNFPGLDGLKRVTALKQHFTPPTHTTAQEIAMDEWLIQLLAQLGIEVSQQATSVSAEQGQQALEALSSLQQRLGEAEKSDKDEVVLKAVDLTQYVPKAVYDATLVEIAELKGKTDQHSVQQVIDSALDDGRAFAREEGYLQQFGAQQGVAALTLMLQNRPAIAALKSQQSSEIAPPPQTKADTLNAEERAVLKACGLNEAAFLKQRDNA